MNFLKKLGTPFVALWRWIKETAWVQPLLIVGVIFAIIFSIPSITSWVQSWDFGDDKYNWLENKQLSLEGITDEKIDGEAADFFSTFEEAQSFWKNDNKDEARKTMKSYTGDADKLFLYFVQENDAANNINEANKYLVEEAWKDKVTSRAQEAGIEVKGSFQYRTIFTDQTIEDKDGEYIYESHTAFEYLLKSREFESFYSTIYSAYQNTAYYQNIIADKVTGVQLDSYQSSINSLRTTTNPSAPTLFIIDLSDNSKNDIVSNIVFSIDGSDKYARADFLANAWVGLEQFKF